MLKLALKPAATTLLYQTLGMIMKAVDVFETSAMPHLHPLRSPASSANVLDLGRRFSGASEPLDDIDDSVASVAAVGEMLERMQTQIEEQAAQIADYKRQVRDLAMHKEAAYSEMTKAEAALRSERERASQAERLCQQLTASEREAQEKIKRLIVSVRTTFNRAEHAAASDLRRSAS